MFTGAFLILLLTLTVTTAPATAATLSSNDFKLQSFSKITDFYDYARAQAAALNKTPPDPDKHAYLYQVYINQSGFQLFYSGLDNITNGNKTVTAPVQSFIEHYKTPEGKDVIVSSSFIMLLAFKDSSASLYPNSPDRNDNLYASFSRGVDLGNVYDNSTRFSLNSETSIMPLTSSADNLTWEWGMRYTNLSAIWWRMYIDPANPTFDYLPVAVSTYQELNFTYKLVINPTDHTAKLTASYVIGRMTNLWTINYNAIPVVVHYNATGAYRLGGTKISDETIYQFLEEQHIKMSIVQFQTSLVLKETTRSTSNNQNVTDANTDVSNGAISTSAGNEDVFKTDFGTKEEYKLFNYTEDPSETSFQTYNSVTRTTKLAGFARNPLLSLQVSLLKYLPMIVAHIDPPLYQEAKDHLLDMNYADYLTIISYPTYSGFTVEHDPTYTAYIGTVASSSTSTAPYGLIVIGCIAAIAAISVVIIVRRRSPRQLAP